MERAALANGSLQRGLEIVVGLACIILTTSPLWGSLFFPAWWSVGFFLFAIYWLFKSVELTTQGVLSARTLADWADRDWTAAGAALPRWNTIHHLVVIPTYAEPLEVLDNSLRYLRVQDFPHRRIFVVLALEERDPAAREKAEALRARHGASLGGFWTTRHVDRPGEVRGKSSNLAHAVAWAYQRITGELGLDPNDVLVTICDADSRLHPSYLSALTCRYLGEPNGANAFFQPAVLFHANLHRLPTVFRVVDGLYSIMLLARLRRATLITQSTYSVSLATCAAVRFWDVDVIPEDSHIFYKAFFRLGRRVTVRPIFLPVWADAAEGESAWETLVAHYTQVRRWAWGASDIPYLLYHGARAGHQPIGLRCLRIGSYIKEHLLWASHWFILAAGFKLLPWLAPAYLATPEAALIEAWASGLFSAGLPCLIGLLLTDRWLRARFAPHVAPPESWPPIVEWLIVPVTGFAASVLPALDAQVRLLLGRRLEYEVTAKQAPDRVPAGAEAGRRLGPAAPAMAPVWAHVDESPASAPPIAAGHSSSARP